MSGRGRRAGWLVAVILAVVLTGTWGETTLWAQPTDAAQDGFVPMDEIPPEDELPAAPLVMTAYAAAWAIVIGYLWTIWKRLGNVEKELADVGRRVSAGDRAGTGA